MLRFRTDDNRSRRKAAARRTVLAVGLLAGVALFASKRSARGADPVNQEPIPISDAVAVAMNLTDGDVFAFDPPNVASGPTQLSVPLDGVWQRLVVAPFSNRAADFQVLTPQPDGSLQPVDVGAAHTMRGFVDGIDGSLVAATVSSDGLRARVVLPDDTNYWIEPVAASVAGAAPGEHVVYREDDVIPREGECLSIPVPGGAAAQVQDVQDPVLDGTRGGVAGGGLFIAELAIDADYDYYSSRSSLEDTVAHIEDVINTMNIQYERDVAIRHAITTIIVRTEAETDPYTTTDANDLLSQFRYNWISAPELSIRRDVAQLFTGKNIDGSTIGIAWVGAVCLSFTEYSVVQSTCCGSLSCQTDLSAHELGHNWGAVHCGDDGPGDPNPCSPGCPTYTMNCSLACANRFEPTTSIPSILAHRDTRTCLENGDELRRLIVTANTDTILEGQTLALRATADFRYGDDQDVTFESLWTTDRPDVGWIDNWGYFTADDVDGNKCVVVTASLTWNEVTRTDDFTIHVLDTDSSLALVSSVPPDGAIDARQPYDPDGSNPAGWQSVELTFNGDTCMMTAEQFAIAKEGGVAAAPSVVGIERLGDPAVRLTLSEIIEPGTWMTVTHIPTGSSIRIGSLPADVNGDGRSTPTDILALIDSLNGVGPPRGIWSTDIDRSGQAAPTDVLRTIDLLNGASAFTSWLGQELP